jgi:hypothetical protein
VEVKNMLNEVLKYRLNDKKALDLEDWMKFSLFLAEYIKTSNLCVKIYISVPSSLLFSYFTVLGAVDHDYRNPSKIALLEQYLSLKQGQRILYKVGEHWVAYSVLEVGVSPINLRAIIVRDRQDGTTYIPETRWFDYVRLHGDEVTAIKNIRTVQGVESLAENQKLNKMYSVENLNLVTMQNTPYTYLYANKKEWQTYLNNVELELFGEKLTLDEIIFDGSEGQFKNISFIEQNQEKNLPINSTVLFVGSSRTLRKMDEFKHLKSIYLVDQNDSTEKLEELELKIEQQFLMGKCKSFNEDILRELKVRNIALPKGVELFAWIPKGES